MIKWFKKKKTEKCAHEWFKSHFVKYTNITGLLSGIGSIVSTYKCIGCQDEYNLMREDHFGKKYCYHCEEIYDVYNMHECQHECKKEEPKVKRQCGCVDGESPYKGIIFYGCDGWKCEDCIHIYDKKNEPIKEEPKMKCDGCNIDFDGNYYMLANPGGHPIIHCKKCYEMPFDEIIKNREIAKMYFCTECNKYFPELKDVSGFIPKKICEMCIKIINENQLAEQLLRNHFEKKDKMSYVDREEFDEFKLIDKEACMKVSEKLVGLQKQIDELKENKFPEFKLKVGKTYCNDDESIIAAINSIAAYKCDEFHVEVKFIRNKYKIRNYYFEDGRYFEKGMPELNLVREWKGEIR